MAKVTQAAPPTSSQRSSELNPSSLCAHSTDEWRQAHSGRPSGCSLMSLGRKRSRQPCAALKARPLASTPMGRRLPCHDAGTGTQPADVSPGTI